MLLLLLQTYHADVAREVELGRSAGDSAGLASTFVHLLLATLEVRSRVLFELSLAAHAVLIVYPLRLRAGLLLEQ